MDKRLNTLRLTIFLIISLAALAACNQVANQPDTQAVATTAEAVKDNSVALSTQTPIVTVPTATLNSQAQGVDTPDNSSSIKHETRALWSWAGRTASSKKAVDDLVAQVDQAHLNVILFGIYRDGTAYFEPSHTRFPDAKERLINKSGFKGDGYQDALSYLLAIRDERRSDDNPFNDFEVHAWITVHRGGDVERGWPPKDITKPYMLNALFPEFKLKYGDYYQKHDERFVNSQVSVLNQPKFRAYMTDLIAGLVEDYDVDGVHLDFIRTGGICFNNEALDYPGTQYDYPGCQEDYKAWTRDTYGHEYTLWDDTDGSREVQDGDSGRVAAWQEHTVGLLVKRIHDEVKAVRPHIIISVASVRNDTSRTGMQQLINGQAAWEWLDQGWIDAAFVTAYSAEAESVVNKIRAVREATQKESSINKIFPGLITFDLDNPREFWSDSIVKQVDAVMYQEPVGESLEPPTEGVALFRDGKLSPEAIDALGTGPFAEPALPFWAQ